MTRGLGTADGVPFKFMRKVFRARERRKTSNVEDARHDGTLLEWGMFRMERADAVVPAVVRAKFSCSPLTPRDRKFSGKMTSR